MSNDEPRQTSFLPSAGQLALAYEQSRDGNAPVLASARGVGRPKGAQNKRTQKVARYFVQRYGDPIDIYGNLLTTPMEALVQTIREADRGDDSETIDRLEAMIDKLAMHCSEKDAGQLYRRLMKFMSRKEVGAMEVAEWWRKMLQDAMTYVHGRQPISVDVAERKDAVLIIPGINAPADVSQQDLAAAIERRGLAALDFESLKLTEESAEDAEFEEVDDDSDDGADDDGEAGDDEPA